MKELIGFWLISLGITIFFVSLQPLFSIKEKLKEVVMIMAFMTLVLVGAFILIGGV